jgi:type VI secretion system protein ImpA
MLRGFRWGELRSNGGELDPKQLAAPPTQVRTKLKGFLLDSKWAELLAAAEGVMASAHGRGWLDLQRYVLTACSNLGSEYDNVANGIRGALASLLHDIPDLVNATLMDDTPTANSETRTWLRNELSGVDAAPTVEVPADEGEGPVVPADGKRTRDAYDRAMMEVRAGRPEKGVELLMREVAQEKSERAKFLRRAQVAGIMVDAGMEEVALPILRDLLQHVETHQLETWEAGETVARPLSLLQRCLVKAEGESEQARDLYLRVCRLDPMQAMAWPKSAEAAASQPASSSDGSSEG